MSDGVGRRAFALKEHRDLDSVGAIVINGASGASLNVREALEQAPDGVYVTDHPEEIAALAGYDPVKGVSLPEPKQAKQAAKSGGKE